MKPLILLKIIQFTASFVTSIGLFSGGYKLFELGTAAKGTFDIRSSFLSGSITAESAGLAMIFAGVVVFLAPFLHRVKVTRDRISLVGVQTFALIAFISLETYRRLLPGFKKGEIMSGGIHNVMLYHCMNTITPSA